MSYRRRRDMIARNHFGVCDLFVRVVTSGLLVGAMWLMVTVPGDPIVWALALMIVFFRDRLLELLI